MGIEFLFCNECETGFPDVYDYEYCGCGRVWCDEECSELGGLRKEYDDDGEYDGDGTCKYCREEDFEDRELLNFFLKKEGIRREDVIKLYKKRND